MKKFALFFIYIIFAVGLFADVKFNGSFENITGVSYVENENIDATNIAQLRMKLQYKADAWRMYSDFKVSTYSGFTTIQTPQINLDRLFIKATLGSVNFTLGRDYLSFGTPFIFNTLEWHKNFSLLDPTVLKPAINLVSATIPVGTFGKFKTFVGGDDDLDVPLVGSELVLGASGIEGGITYQHKDWNTHVVGGFLKVDLGATFVASYSAHLQNVIFESEKFAQYHEVGVGIDYSIPVNFSSILLSQSFYLNNKDANAQWYSYSSGALTIDEFTSCGVDVLLNMVDFSGSVIPQISMIVLDGIDLNIGAGINFGEEKSEFFMDKSISPRVTGMIKVTATF